MSHGHWFPDVLGQSHPMVDGCPGDEDGDEEDLPDVKT